MTTDAAPEETWASHIAEMLQSVGSAEATPYDDTGRAWIFDLPSGDAILVQVSRYEPLEPPWDMR